MKIAFLCALLLLLLVVVAPHGATAQGAILETLDVLGRTGVPVFVPDDEIPERSDTVGKILEMARRQRLRILGGEILRHDFVEADFVQSPQHGESFVGRASPVVYPRDPMTVKVDKAAHGLRELRSIGSSCPPNERRLVGVRHCIVVGHNACGKSVSLLRSSG